MKKDNDYSSKNIKEMDDISHIRKRSGMYVGNGAGAVKQLFYEVLSNSLDEASVGFCNKINISLDKKNRVTIADNGRGIPWQDTKDVNGKDVPACVLAATSLKVSGKFDTKAYSVSAGLNGVGLKAVNALSDYFRLETHRDGKAFYFECKQGKITKKLTYIGKCKDTGTIITYSPDPEMFTDGEDKYNEKDIIEMCKFSAYLNPVKIIFEGQEKKVKFFFEDGALQFVNDEADRINKANKTKNIIKEPILIKGKVDNVEVNVALLYTSAGGENLNSFVNGIRTILGGTHLTGTKLAISKVFTQYITSSKMLEGRNKNVEVTGDDCRDGLICFCSVRLPSPEFRGQTKDELGSREAQGACQKLVGDALKDLIARKPDTARAIASAIVAAARGRIAAKKAKEVARKEILDGGSFNFSAKLKDCVSNDPEECYLYITEGDSAAGSAVSCRDVNTQAVLPLRGKILNTFNSTLSALLENQEINSIVSAIGTGIGDNFDISKLRYNHICLLTDSDVDGNHIKILLLTLFYRWMPELIKQGHIFIPKSPLYIIKKGAKIIGFLEDDKEKEKFIKKKFKEAGLDPNENDKAKIDNALKGISLGYVKGLGELNPEDLGETTLNKENQRLIQVTMEDCEDTFEKMRILMDNKAVDERKDFINENAIYASLDI